MNAIHPHEAMLIQPRERRLKVSKACFACRVKKIKCDGLQPCMQCKARQRPCSFSKDGTLDDTPDLTQYPHHKRRRSSIISQELPKPAHQSCMFQQQQQQDTTIASSRTKEQEKFHQSFQQLDKLSMMWPGEGKEGRWSVDINLLHPIATTEQQAENIIPSQQQQHINSNLINLFFRHCYTAFPILSRSLFYRLLEQKDAMITPLLLNSIYCHAAHFSPQEESNANTYYKNAYSLLQEYMDKPSSLSTIISLCLLSTFEFNRCYNNNYAAANTNHYRSRRYSDLAFRMCWDLKLHKRCLNQQVSTTPDDNELRKRVYWVCYCLDKLSGLMTGRPYLLHAKEVEIDLPMVLLESDHDDANSCFLQHIKLMQICERILQLNSSSSMTDGAYAAAEKKKIELDQQLLYWLDNLPQQFQWTPTNTTDVPIQPPLNALVAHLHLIYNYVEISLLQQPLAISTTTVSPTSLLMQQRCASIATNLTQLTSAMVDEPHFIASFTLTSKAIMAAVRLHMMDCADEKFNKARHARLMFQKSLKSLKSLLHHRVIEGIQEFATTIERTLTDADHGVGNSSSPKLHVLSPMIPRNLPNNSVVLEDRWAKLNNNMVAAGGTYNHYGLISPASSTDASSATVAMNEKESTSLMYNESMDPYSRITSASFTNNTTSYSCSTPNSSWRPPSSRQQQTMNADAEIYSLWDGNSNKEQQQQQEPTMLFTASQSQGGRFGLGVYASAKQHHTDVIRQHMPNNVNLKANTHRPVLLNHYGQVIVVATTDNNSSSSTTTTTIN